MCKMDDNFRKIICHKNYFSREKSYCLIDVNYLCMVTVTLSAPKGTLVKFLSIKHDRWKRKKSWNNYVYIDKKGYVFI